MKFFAFLISVLLWPPYTQAHVSLIAPKGGETFTPGQTVKITWKETVAHDTENWDLYFSKDGGTTYESLQLNIDVKVLEYEWVVPLIATEKGRIKVVQDNKNEGDYSDESAFFTIKSIQTAASADNRQKEVVVFPNPANDVIYVKNTGIFNSDASVFVMDQMGRLIYKQHSAFLSPESILQINTSEWPAGLFWIAIENRNAIEVRRILKQ